MNTEKVLMSHEKDKVVQLYKEHYNTIFRFFSKRLHLSEDSADSTQEVFTRFVRSNGAAAQECSAAYLWRIARNLVKEIRRTRAIRSQWLVPHSEDADELPSQAPGPEELMIDQQIAEEILAVLHKLSPRCREFFILHRFKGLSHREIAKQLEISPKTVENHMVKALLFLRKNLPCP